MKTKLPKLFAIASITYSLLGCVTMPNHDTIQFKKHDFAPLCFSASDMTLLYARYPYALCTGKVARAKTQRDVNDLPSVIGGIPGIGGTTTVQWRAKDGTQHEYTLDFKELFHNGILLHEEDSARVFKPNPTAGNPVIIVEVNDKTLSVYMGVGVILVPPDGDESKRSSTYKNVLAFSKTF